MKGSFGKGFYRIALKRVYYRVMCGDNRFIILIYRGWCNIFAIAMSDRCSLWRGESKGTP